MLSLVRHTAARRVAAGHVRAAAPQLRAASGIKMLEEKGRAAEGMYWHQEDEKLLKKMIESHPELNPEYQGIANILADDTSMEGKVKMIFMKHGIPPVNKALISDILALLESKA